MKPLSKIEKLENLLKENEFRCIIIEHSETGTKVLCDCKEMTLSEYELQKSTHDYIININVL